jgi:hypothetical protein
MPGNIGKKEGLGNILGKKNSSRRMSRMGRKSSAGTARRGGGVGTAGSGAGTADAIANMQSKSHMARIREVMQRLGRR